MISDHFGFSGRSGINLASFWGRAAVGLTVFWVKFSQKKIIVVVFFGPSPPRAVWEGVPIKAPPWSLAAPSTTM